MRRMFIDGVNEVMSDLWESIYPYGDFVGVQLAVEGGERGGDYVLKLRDRAGEWVPVEGIASGGERTDACLALRIAFSIVLAPNLRWIVFDEPTHNLDAEGIQELAKILRDRLPNVVRQILLITHEERLESAVSGYLYRFSRDKDSDEPTKVEQVMVPELFE
jgi:DNA repair exonuclease SbcCD ATPase subunit